MSHPPQNPRKVNPVILPLNGREDGAASDSIFSRSDHRNNITIIGEIFRKLIHLAAISIPVGYYFLGAQIVLSFLFVALIASLSIDYIRIFGENRSRGFIYKYMGILFRPHERKNFVGATYILTGSILTILFFDKMIAIVAISFIVLGDTAGAIIGRLWGTVRFRNKSLEGSISFFLACLIAAVVAPGIPFWVKVIGALCATIVEAITLHIDDNLIVPITSAALMQVIVSQIVILEHFA